MKQDTFERLVIDGASGELTPDVAELLEAHLETSSAMAGEAARIREILQLAKLALAEPKISAPKKEELPDNIIALPSPTAERTSNLKWASGMAACFAAGICLGLLGQRPATPRATPKTVAQITPIQTLPAAQLPAQNTFWSVKNFRIANSTVNTARNNHLIWRSPLMKPELASHL